MNKYKFIDYLHHPEKMTAEQLAEISDVLKDYPYFQTARTLFAKAKKSKDPVAAKSAVNSAAIYVFDRAYLKKYLESQLFFIETREAESKRKELATKEDAVKEATPTAPKLKSPIAKPPITEQKKESAKPSPEAKKEPSSRPSKPAQETKAPPIKKEVSKEKDFEVESLAPQAPTDLDKLIEEVFQDMAELRKSKSRFLEWQEKHDMEEAVEKAMSAAQNKETPEPPEEKKDETEVGDATTEKEEAISSETTEIEKTDSEKVENKEEVETVEPSDEEAKQEIVAKEDREYVEIEVKAKAETIEDDLADSPETENISQPNAEDSEEEVQKESRTAAEEDAFQKDIEILSASADIPLDADRLEVQNSPLKRQVKTFEDLEKSEATDSKKKEVEEKQKPEKTTKSKTTKAATSKKTTKAKDSTAKSPTAKKKASTGTKKPKASPKETKEDKPEAKETISKPTNATTEKIIDEFIEKQPSISKPDPKANTDKDDLAKSSTRFHADIASEYLAEIYIEQGKEYRAIEIYENLILKFPEKKSYFAGLIEKLKK